VIEALAGLLVATMVGVPLATALTATTAILAGIATILALAGLFIRSSALLTAAVIVGLVEELVAVMQAGAPTDLLSPVLLGIVMYLLLEVSAFAKAFRGVRVDASVFSMKLAYWGWTSVLWGLCGLGIGMLAAGMARPVWTPVLPHLLAIAAAGLTLAALVMLIRSRHG
jgi:hypothetical protein